jgi:hypothetical protein
MFTQIKINDLSISIFDQLSKKEIKLLKNATTSFVVQTNVYNKLLQIEKFPIENKKLAITNVLKFLEYLDKNLHESYDNKIQIPKSVFESYFTAHHYIKYQEILSKLNIISVTAYLDGSFYNCNYEGKKGPVLPSKCKLYAVSHDYINNDNCLSLIIPKQRNTSIKIDNQIPELDKRFINTISTIGVDLLAAINSEIKEYRKRKINFIQLTCRLHRLFQMKRKRFIKYGPKVNRIYHSLSNISRISRKHLDVKMFYLDVKNCQPLLLCALMKRDNYTIDDQYQKDCENAVFYENFYPMHNDDRNITKVMTYRHVFFGFKPHEEVNKRFKVLYPKTWGYLYKLSKTGVSLASRLQNLEAELFNNLSPEKSKKYFTLFDAIYFNKKQDSAELWLKIEKFFGELGLKVKLDFKENKKDIE